MNVQVMGMDMMLAGSHNCRPSNAHMLLRCNLLLSKPLITFVLPHLYSCANRSIGPSLPSNLYYRQNLEPNITILILETGRLFLSKHYRRASTNTVTP